jgi:WxL domain surface cell wall-binding
MVCLSSTANPFKENTDIMRQRIIITLALAALTLAAATAAFGAGVTTTATVTGTAGVSLAFPANPSITDTLDGTDQTVNYSALLGVVDARGTGAGWNLQISATSFTDAGSHTLAPGTVTSAAQACVAGSTCTVAVNSGITLPLTISTTPAKFFNAALLSGLGKVNVTPTIAVAIPGNAYAGVYTSTVTLAATTGP